MSLRNVFENFKRNQKSLQNIHKDTLECFGKIEVSLSQAKHRELVEEISHKLNASELEELTLPGANGQPEPTVTRNLTESLYTPDEQSRVARLFSQRPSLIVVGQTNCGKSSIINELLGCKVVSTSDQPCTARIVRMTYSKDPFVRLVTRDGNEIDPQTDLPTNKVPRDLIELREQDREDKDRVTAIIEAGLDIGFLKSGVDIIDSPGRNENPVLDELVRNQLDSILPFIVYVVDGHNLFTSLDKIVLDEILEGSKELEIFYVVSKIEPEKMDSSDEDDDSDEEEETVTRKEPVQESKKRRVYEKLVKNGFLIPEGKTIHSHENFHGLSAWKTYEYSRKKKKNPQWDDPEGVYKEYNDAFKRFQTCLLSFSESNLKASVEKSCHVLISVLSRCLNFFIQKANLLRKSKDETVSMISQIQREEKEVHANVLAQIEKQRAEIIEMMTETISELGEGILKEARDFQYSELGFVIPPNGLVGGAEAVSMCRSQIEQMVINKVRTSMKETLVKMFASRDEFLIQVEERMKKIEKEAFPDGHGSNAAISLHLNLVSCYTVLASPTKSFWDWNKILKRLSDFIKNFIKRPLTTIRGKVNVGEAVWKECQAANTLKALNMDSVVDNVIKTMQERFNDCHEMFEEDVKTILDVFNRGVTLKDEQRKAIIAFSPDVASLEMLCHSIKDRLKYGNPNKGDMIGSGAQGNVFTCDNITTPEGRPCVVKVIPVSSEVMLKDLTLELHNTRTLDHPNILPIVCTIIEPNVFTGFTVSIVSERMKSDLYVALPNLPSLRTRLKIILDVAHALQYLHQQGLMHRDVKLQNVLIDDENRGRLTDMGLCKPEGLTEGSLVGTPIAMAPEMIKQKYSKSVDVYAFGILMWRVFEGQGNQPRNIFLHVMPIIMLAVNALEERRPEKLDIFLEPCWQLMEKCWASEPGCRPLFDEIVTELNEILKDESIQ